MSVSRRAIVCLVLLLAAGATAAWLVPRVRDRARDAVTTGTVTETKDPAPGAPASETLIAAALSAGEITYEESLLARAYALYDDPRLQAAFRSPIVNWDAGLELWLEIDAHEAKLSKPLLDQLAPFRLRPNHPDSIYNRPRADVVRTQATQTPRWIDLTVPDSNLRVWIQGTREELQPFADMAATTTTSPGCSIAPSVTGLSAHGLRHARIPRSPTTSDRLQSTRSEGCGAATGASRTWAGSKRGRIAIRRADDARVDRDPRGVVAEHGAAEEAAQEGLIRA